ALTYSEQYLDRHPAVVPFSLARLRKLFTVESLRVACEQTFFPEADDARLLFQVRCPTLMVRPKDERLLPRASAERVAFQLPKGRLEDVPGGHRLLEEAPEKTFDLVASFVERAVCGCHVGARQVGVGLMNGVLSGKPAPIF
ncbi:MAG: alpha/beta hydrolase, partial [Actinomycetota bacterium]|nr:alpha/beta hydrolase [Actinomycetota bacterium]